MNNTNGSWLPVAVAIAAVLLTAGLVAGCGDDDMHDRTSAPMGGMHGQMPAGGMHDAADLDGAFLTEMTTHHEAAIKMANIAIEEADHQEIRDLARAIVEDQSAEIDEMARLHRQLFGESIRAADHGGLGMDRHEMGMSMDATELRGADEFDREFIDAMIAHHRGAIAMAQMMISDSSAAEIQELAEGIIATQSREIEEMNRWREDWYGAPSPAGDVHSDDDGMQSEEMMNP